MRLSLRLLVEWVYEYSTAVLLTKNLNPKFHFLLFLVSLKAQHERRAAIFRTHFLRQTRWRVRDPKTVEKVDGYFMQDTGCKRNYWYGRLMNLPTVMRAMKTLECAFTRTRLSVTHGYSFYAPRRRISAENVPRSSAERPVQSDKVIFSWLLHGFLLTKILEDCGGSYVPWGISLFGSVSLIYGSVWYWNAFAFENICSLETKIIFLSARLFGCRLEYGTNKANLGWYHSIEFIKGKYYKSINTFFVLDAKKWNIATMLIA